MQNLYLLCSFGDNHSNTRYWEMNTAWICCSQGCDHLPECYKGEKVSKHWGNQENDILTITKFEAVILIQYYFKPKTRTLDNWWNWSQNELLIIHYKNQCIQSNFCNKDSFCHKNNEQFKTNHIQVLTLEFQLCRHIWNSEQLQWDLVLKIMKIECILTNR